ncbi:hypothetical protein OEV98_09925 [Caldibacillus lycopersici]|uniref:Uncharacterized protein n=1 Tax=Perspicuibacillus lycopersici TaxID=1325689 RepID=A0AAE3ITH0_9BACI|nr:hypothetical protein [Perspicuibacillus lycopersici]MCU9613877.1 hypothetical protein [Perspicuibacillus lycopersici]
MLSRLFRVLLISAGIVMIYKYRFKLMNKVLGNEKLRAFAVQFSMKIPAIRNLFMQTAFRS